MHEYSSLEIIIAPSDNGDYASSPLEELLKNGWRLLDASIVFGTEISMNSNRESLNKKGDPRESIKHLREFEQKQWMCGTHLFWQDTEQYVTISFRPQGHISIDIRKAIEISNNAMDVDWFITNLISPLEDSKIVEFLTYYHLSSDSTQVDRDNWAQESETVFTKDSVELSDLTLEVNEIDSTVLGMISTTGEAWICIEEENDRGSITVSRNNDKTHLQLVLDIDTFSGKRDTVRNLVGELINSIPETRKISDGPSPMLRQHSIELEMHSPSLDTVSMFLQRILRKLFETKKDEKVLFLYN